MEKRQSSGSLVNIKESKSAYGPRGYGGEGERSAKVLQETGKEHLESRREVGSRGRGQLRVILSSERVFNVSLGSWLSSEEWTERRQYAYEDRKGWSWDWPGQGGPQRPALMRKQTWVATRGEAARKQKQLSLGRGAQSPSMCVCVGEVHVYGHKWSSVH